MRGDPKHRIARRGDPAAHHVIEQTQLLPVRQLREAVGESGIDGLLHLVEPRQGRRASDEEYFRRARLEGGGGIVESGRGEPDHRDPAAREGGEVDVLRAVADRLPRPKKGGQRLRDAGRRLPLSSGREDHAAGMDRLRPVRSVEPHPDRGRTRLDGDHLDLVPDLRAGHPAIPAEIVRPDRSGDPAERVPVVPLGHPPRPEREPGDPQHRPGEVLGRAQGLHACAGQPRPFPPLGAPVHVPQVRDPEPAEGERRRQPAHPRARDRDIDHPPPVGTRAGRDPVRRRVVQALEVARERCFEPFESVCSAHRLIPGSRPCGLPISRRTAPNASSRGGKMPQDSMVVGRTDRETLKA